LKTGHPPAECGIKMRDEKATAILGLFSYFRETPAIVGGFFLAIIINPIELLAFITRYDIFFIGKKICKGI
jgi:hypothetical protein